jgi:hypothetical protein
VAAPGHHWRCLPTSIVVLQPSQWKGTNSRCARSVLWSDRRLVPGMQRRRVIIHQTHHSNTLKCCYPGIVAAQVGYMPKDSPSDVLGHRHEWGNAAVWLFRYSTSTTPLGLAVSQHGGYSTTTSPLLSDVALVGHVSFWPMNHQRIADWSVGGSQPLVAWESLPATAQTALTKANFPRCPVPLGEPTSRAHLVTGVLLAAVPIKHLVQANVGFGWR